MRRKLRVAVLFGGRSAEHEVSLQSAKNVIASLDQRKYEIMPVGIDRKGGWHQLGNLQLLNSGSEYHRTVSRQGGKIEPTSIGHKVAIDVVFPVLHGTYGEDGTVQGLLKLANVPFVGAGVLGSAVGMDKDVQKRLLHEAGIPTAKFLVYQATNDLIYKNVISQLGSSIFIKPANLGSSVGVSKVASEKEFKIALRQAFKFDRKILIEEAVIGREIECSVLGNEDPIASLPGEVVPSHDFYDYEAKYIDENGATLIIPAKLPKPTVKKIQDLAIKTFQVLCCEGMARVDMFLKKDGTILINEINTIPGFTNISMYPKLWEASGTPYSKLIDMLIELALDRFKKEQKLLISAKSKPA